MMKWVSIILGFLFSSKPSTGSHFKEIALEVVDEAMVKSRKPIGLILLGLASIILVCGGIFISMVDITRQYDISGSIYFGATFWSGLTLASVVLVGYLYAFTRAWPGMKHIKDRVREKEMAEEAAKNAAPGLDEAISLLIMDHIEARKMSRTRKQESRGTSESFGHSDRQNEQPTPPAGFA